MKSGPVGAWVDARDHGSCNFCDRGEFTPDGDLKVNYPYELVFHVRPREGGTSVRFCLACVRDLSLLVQGSESPSKHDRAWVIRLEDMRALPLPPERGRR